MPKWTAPVYDRVLLDVTSKTSKGLFNLVDWIRVNGNTEYLAALLNVIQEMASREFDVNALTAPTITTIPTATNINNLIENINIVQEGSGLPTSFFTTLPCTYLGGSNADAPDYLDVNDWEENIFLVKNYVFKPLSYSIQSGVSGVGQVRLWQSRFRVKTFSVPASGSPVRRVRCGIGGASIGAMRQNSFRRYAV